MLDVVDVTSTDLKQGNVRQPHLFARKSTYTSLFGSDDDAGSRNQYFSIRRKLQMSK